MVGVFKSLACSSILIFGLAVISSADETPAITIPSRQNAPPDREEPSDSSATQQSTSLPDPADTHWKIYENHIVKIHLRIQQAWTMMEFKETKNSGAVNFTLSRAPAPLVTFSATREPRVAPLEEYISRATLTPLYPNGYQTTTSTLAGRKATLVTGQAKDGRREESYFVSDKDTLTQVVFSAPPEDWNATRPQFDAMKKSFRWVL